VIRRPVFGSVICLGRSVSGFSGVRTIEPPSTLHTSVAPGRKCNRVRAFFGKTICPLLDKVALMAYRLTVPQVSQPSCAIAAARIF
jgi:hypothetical protein